MKGILIKNRGGISVDDKSIVDLYFSRNEEAIIQTDKKYGRYCYTIAYNILTNREDAEESVSDTYMTAWRTIPPHYPSVLSPSASDFPS